MKVLSLHYNDYYAQLSIQITDSGSFGIVFHQHYSALCYFAERLVGSHDDAEDIVEDLFVKIWQKGLSFETELHLKAFLYRSAKNACLDFLKTSGRSGLRNAWFAEQLGNQEESYLHEIIRTEIVSDIVHAINSLPAQCAKIITMSYLDGKTNQEIAAELNLSVQTVKNQKGRGLSLLKERLPNDKFRLLFLLSYLPLFDLLSKH